MDVFSCLLVGPTFGGELADSLWLASSLRERKAGREREKGEEVGEYEQLKQESG